MSAKEISSCRGGKVSTSGQQLTPVSCQILLVTVRQFKVSRFRKSESCQCILFLIVNENHLLIFNTEFSCPRKVQCTQSSKCYVVIQVGSNDFGELVVSQGDVLLAADQKGNRVQVVMVDPTTGHLLPSNSTIATPPQPAQVAFFSWPTAT